MKTREAIIGLFNQNFNKVTHLSDLDEFIDSLGEHRKTYPAQTHTPEIEHKHVFGKKIHKRYGHCVYFKRRSAFRVYVAYANEKG